MSDLDRLARDGVIDGDALKAADRYCHAVAVANVHVLSEAGQAAVIDAQRRLRSLDRAVAVRVGLVGLSVVRTICVADRSAGMVALDLGFARGDRPDLGDARRVHGLIRVSFAALVSAFSNERPRVTHEIIDIPVGVVVDAPCKPKASR